MDIGQWQFWWMTDSPLASLLNQEIESMFWQKLSMLQEKDRQITKTILEDVLVLSTGFNVSNSIPLIGMKMAKEIKKMNLSTYERYNTVSLEVTPFQAQKLTHVIKFLDPKPFLSLRNNNDKQIVRSQSTRLYDILGEDKTEAIEYFRNKRKKK